MFVNLWTAIQCRKVSLISEYKANFIYRHTEVILHIFLTWVIDGDEWSACTF